MIRKHEPKTICLSAADMLCSMCLDYEHYIASVGASHLDHTDECDKTEANEFDSNQAATHRGNAAP